MQYIYDHDLHIHSFLSSCSRNPKQNPQRILEYAKENNLHTICITDHMWDSKIRGASLWYRPQNFKHISKSKPLPQTDGIRFLFGCEAEVTKRNVLGLSKPVIDALDFIVIPTTHFHMRGFTISKEDAKSPESIAKNWIERFEHVLDMDLPFHKVGIAHLTCSCIGPSKDRVPETLNCIPTEEMQRLFQKAQKVGVGIEINADDMDFKAEFADSIFRPYRIAKECGCKFYLGSDAHGPEALNSAKGFFKIAIAALELEESDKIEFLKEKKI